jgi:hypothetical protein
LATSNICHTWDRYAAEVSFGFVDELVAAGLHGWRERLGGRFVNGCSKIEFGTQRAPRESGHVTWHHC